MLMWSLRVPLPICFTNLLWEDIQLFLTVQNQRGNYDRSRPNPRSLLKYFQLLPLDGSAWFQRWTRWSKSIPFQLEEKQHCNVIRTYFLSQLSKPANIHKSSLMPLQTPKPFLNITNKSVCAVTMEYILLLSKVALVKTLLAFIPKVHTSNLGRTPNIVTYIFSVFFTV
jgi:hypothetical protein